MCVCVWVSETKVEIHYFLTSASAGPVRSQGITEPLKSYSVFGTHHKPVYILKCMMNCECNKGWTAGRNFHACWFFTEQWNYSWWLNVPKRLWFEECQFSASAWWKCIGRRGCDSRLFWNQPCPRQHPKRHPTWTFLPAHSPVQPSPSADRLFALSLNCSKVKAFGHSPP